MYTLCKTAVRALAHHKGRSLLTMLGIIIGIAAVSATMSIGHSTQLHLKKQVLALGDNYLWVSAQATGKAIKKSLQIRPTACSLTIDDAYAIKKECPAIKRVSPHLTHAYDLYYGGKAVRALIKSGNEEYLSILGREIVIGNAFMREHGRKKAKVIILGADLAHTLFGYEEPCGKIILIKKIPFIVLGVCKKIHDYIGNDNPNLDAFVPLTTAKNYLSTSRKYISRTIAGMTLSAHSYEQLKDASEQVRQLLRKRHHLASTDPDDFFIQDQSSLLTTASKTTETFSLFLLIIAFIALLIGGIGVMNIMLVCVTERQQEIGIRMALGATTYQLQLQFLIEALLITSIGGIIGIVLGIMLPFFLQHTAPWPLLIDYQALAWIACIIIAIGLLFGYYPARKAARLDPIKALLR